MTESTAEKRILVLPSWYPSAVQHGVGDFVQRHVEAISPFAAQHVIHVVKDELAKVTKKIAVVKNQQEGYTEEIIYYHPKKTGMGLLDKLLSDITYTRLYKKAIEMYIATNGLPSLTHVHVALKAGWLAVWLKKKYKVPYVVTEHWSGYLDAAEEKFTGMHPFLQARGRQVFDAANRITTVSVILKKAIGKITNNTLFSVIPNVVDQKVFFLKPHEQNEQVRFIHASSMNWPKNTEGILKAVQLLKDMNPRFVLRLFGPMQPSLKAIIRTYGISDHILYEGNVSQQELAAAMRASDAFLMNSRYETFGNVVIEANACGLPVIATDIPVFHEIITENINGSFVKEDDPAALAQQMLLFMQGKLIFNQKNVSASSEKYVYGVVGKQFVMLYDELIINS